MKSGAYGGYGFPIMAAYNLQAIGYVHNKYGAYVTCLCFFYIVGEKKQKYKELRKREESMDSKWEFVILAYGALVFTAWNTKKCLHSSVRYFSTLSFPCAFPLYTIYYILK